MLFGLVIEKFHFPNTLLLYSLRIFSCRFFRCPKVCYYSYGICVTAEFGHFLVTKRFFLENWYLKIIFPKKKFCSQIVTKLFSKTNSLRKILPCPPAAGGNFFGFFRFILYKKNFEVPSNFFASPPTKMFPPHSPPPRKKKALFLVGAVLSPQNS